MSQPDSHHNEAAERWAESVFAPDDAAIRFARKVAVERGIRPISVDPLEAKLLGLLLRLIGARRAVEIGTLYGYSGLVMARALPSDGHLWTCEADAAHADAAETVFRRAKISDRVTLVRGPAAETLPTLAGHGPFDAVFIDADKTGYPRYLDWAEKNVRVHGLIMGHNAFAFGRVHLPPDAIDDPDRRPEVAAIQEFNRRLAAPERYDAVLVPTREGLTVARKLF
jgi:predicted O-methyltransferase YrrM